MATTADIHIVTPEEGRARFPTGEALMLACGTCGVMMLVAPGELKPNEKPDCGDH